MGITDRLQSAIKKGQEESNKSISVLEGQNSIIIDNMNEIIELQKKICDKLGIEAKVEEDVEE